MADSNLWSRNNLAAPALLESLSQIKGALIAKKIVHTISVRPKTWIVSLI